MSIYHIVIFCFVLKKIAFVILELNILYLTTQKTCIILSFKLFWRFLESTPTKSFMILHLLLKTVETFPRIDVKLSKVNWTGK